MLQAQGVWLIYDMTGGLFLALRARQAVNNAMLDSVQPQLIQATDGSTNSTVYIFPPAGYAAPALAPDVLQTWLSTFSGLSTNDTMAYFACVLP